MHSSESAQYAKAREAAERAVELAPAAADGWTMLGTVLAWGALSLLAGMPLLSSFS